jgi:transposase
MNTNEAKSTSKELRKPICKLGLDCHAGSITVARQIEGLNPQPAQKFSVAKFLQWMQEQLKKGFVMHSCYEAGPTGYWLHRKLEAMGVSNLVVCPTRLDSRGKGVNTDKTDATELLVRLDRYVAGNKKALAVVAVPTAEQEQKRAVSRQREQLRRKRQSFAAQGRTLLLVQGLRHSNNWWKAAGWKKVQEEVPVPWIIEALEAFRRVIECVNQEVMRLSKGLESQAPTALPKGMGALTHEVIEREIRDWKRFKNRRQLGSYSGLTGGVSGSGEKSADLSITKCGNRRLSCCLIECAWRLLLKQPDYWLVKKWSPVLRKGGVHVRRRKQAIVAFARQLLIDIWKWKLGRTTPEKLGWQMA